MSRDWLPEQTWRASGEEGERHKHWVYEYRNGADKPWNAFYAFLELEFTPTDWIRVNDFASAPDFIHCRHMIVVKFLGRERASDDTAAVPSIEVYGKRMLSDDIVKENLGGKTKVIHVCQDEEDRVRILQSHFEIELTAEERQGIGGWKTELQ